MNIPLIILLFFLNINELDIPIYKEIVEYKIDHYTNDTLVSITEYTFEDDKLVIKKNDTKEIIIDSTKSVFIYKNIDTVYKYKYKNDNTIIYTRTKKKRRFPNDTTLNDYYYDEELKNVEVYDANGNLTSNISMGYVDKSDYQISFYKYIYNKFGRIENMKELFSDYRILSDEDYIYNEKNELIKKIINFNYYYDKHTQGFITPFDYINYYYENNNLKYEVHIVDSLEKRDYKSIKDFLKPNYFQIFEFKYDENNEIIEEIFYKIVYEKFDESILKNTTTYDREYTFITKRR